MDPQQLRKLASDLQRSLAECETGEHALQPAFDAVCRFERLAGAAYTIRRRLPESSELRNLSEDLLASVSHNLLFVEKGTAAFSYDPFVNRYRKVWRKNLPLFAYATALFLVSCIVGWTFSSVRPEYAPVLVPQPMMEAVLDQESWFARIQNSPVLHGFGIAVNNIGVAFKTFAGGALLGLGGLLLLCFNGLAIGALLGYCNANGFAEPLRVFIIAHGPLELSIIVAAGFCSLLYGRAFFMPPYRNFSGNFRAGANEACTVAFGAFPWLILAALVEAFISPVEAVPVALRIAVGSIAALAFWAWTLWPPKD